MFQWRFHGGNSALRTETGTQSIDGIAAAGNGCALFGPYIDVPAGDLTARILLAGPGSGQGRIEIVAGEGARVIDGVAIRLDGSERVIAVSARLDRPESGLEIRLVGELDIAIAGLEIDLTPAAVAQPAPDRPVGYESAKTYAKKIDDGFWHKYLGGSTVLEIGYRGYYGSTLPIVPQAIGVDVGYPGYDGVTLPFADGSFDAIYSSHCLEHIPDYLAVLRDWYRLLKIGGHMVIVVPHQHLFERRAVKPSLWNPDHRRFYTSETLLGELAEAFPENSYRVRHLRENDEGFGYDRLPREANFGCFEIELVVEKIRKPNWNSDDNSVRNYSAGEFFTEHMARPDPWSIALDLSRDDECLAFGPYARLRPARYVAQFCFGDISAERLDDTRLTLDVAANMDRIAYVEMSGAEAIAALRRGTIEIPFELGDTADMEFRIYRHGATADATAIFRGVIVAYA